MTLTLSVCLLWLFVTGTLVMLLVILTHNSTSVMCSGVTLLRRALLELYWIATKRIKRKEEEEEEEVEVVVVVVVVVVVEISLLVQPILHCHPRLQEVKDYIKSLT